MCKNKIKLDNKLVAKFMGKLYTDEQISKFNDEIMIQSNKNFIKRALYHTSWDWLIPVVHKILFNTNLNGTNSDDWENLVKNIQSALSNCEITNLFDTVVEFINWYNKK